MATALSELQRRCFDRMDEGASQYISAQQALDVINEAYSLLWGMYTRAQPAFFEAEYVLTPVVGVRDYPLPANFRRLLSAYMFPLSGQTGAFIPLQQFGRGGYMGGQVLPYDLSYGAYVPTYALIGGNFRIDPIPATNPSYQIALWYYYQYTPLVNQTDTLDASIYPGHEQWIINQAVIQLKIGKEEQPASDLTAANNALAAQIQQDLAQRDVSSSTPVLDSNSYNGWV